MWNKIKQWTQSAKDWWNNVVHTILLARLTALTGFIVGAVGSMNWAPLLAIDVDTGFSRNQVVWLGVLMFAQGVVFELVRRYNAPDIK